jgi:non-homologous end joining protein Ku
VATFTICPAAADVLELVAALEASLTAAKAQSEKSSDAKSA